jgi:Domain of unknown function DUF302
LLRFASESVFAMAVRNISSFSASLLIAGLALLLSPAAGSAQSIQSHVAKGTFEDVKFELTNAIVARGLVIDQTGNIGGMLDRTGADVGSTKPIYKRAEYFTFCSAKLSRQMMEADPLNMAYCPYVMFAFERADAPGQVTIGYRRPDIAGSEASKAALSAIDALLGGIAKDATK